jgi:hypothetical protein
VQQKPIQPNAPVAPADATKKSDHAALLSVLAPLWWTAIPSLTGTRVQRVMIACAMLR